MIGLTKSQAALLQFISGYVAANGGVPPSYRECGCGIGTRSKSRVHQLVIALEERGAIRRVPARERSIEVLFPVAVPSVGNAPLYAVPMRPSPFERYSGERL